MTLIDDLKWRYATKKFSNKKVSDANVTTIVEATNLSASSTGLQPYRLFVVSNPSLQKQLGEGSFNTQIADASHLIVFAAFESIAQEDIDAYIELIASERQIQAEQLADFKNSVGGYLLARTDEENFIWSSKQAYIGLGTALIAAAALKVDATPMEGFDAQKFDELLGINDKRLKSVVVLALGYRDVSQDFLAPLKKVRLPIEDFATSVN